MNQTYMKEKPILPLLLSMALPMMLSMMVQALYNIVDSVFIGMLPERDAALQALGYAYPIQMLLVALGVGVGIGVNAVLSRALGKGDPEKASAAAGNGYFLMLCGYSRINHGTLLQFLHPERTNSRNGKSIPRNLSCRFLRSILPPHRRTLPLCYG